MTCPHCGYARSAFDTHCLRCRLLASGGPPRRFPTPAERTIVMDGPLPSPPLVTRFPWRRAFFLLAVLGGVLGVCLWHTAAPHAPGLERPAIVSHIPETFAR